MAQTRLQTDLQAFVDRHYDDPPKLAGALAGGLAKVLAAAPADIRMELAEIYVETVRKILRKSLT